MRKSWTFDDVWLKKNADGTLSYPFTFTYARQDMWNQGVLPFGDEGTGVMVMFYDTDYVAATGWYLYNQNQPPVDDVVTELAPSLNEETGQYEHTYIHRKYTEEELAALLYQTKTSYLTQARNTFITENLGGVPFTMHPQDGSATEVVHVLSPMTDFVSHFRELVTRAAAGEVTTDLNLLVLEKGHIVIPAAHVGAVAKQILDGRASLETPMSAYLETALASTHYSEVPQPPATFVPATLPVLDLTILNPAA